MLVEVRTIVADNEDVGYLQLTDVAGALDLKEFHIEAPLHNHGIGSEVMRLLLEEARKMAKSMTVSVVEIQSARSFYERAGFRLVGREEHKLYMRHDNGLPLLPMPMSDDIANIRFERVEINSPTGRVRPIRRGARPHRPGA